MKEKITTPNTDDELSLSYSESPSEKINDEQMLIDKLNKARQNNKESELYDFVFGNKSENDIGYPDFLIRRSDLLEKFAVGKNGEPYKNTATAAHDMLDYLVEESEDVLKEYQKIGFEIDKNREINIERNFIEDLENLKSNSKKADEFYSHIFGINIQNDRFPAFLVKRDDILEKFAVGKNGEPYKNTQEAVQDMIQYLIEEAEDIIKSIEKEKSNYGKKKSEIEPENDHIDENTDETEPDIDASVSPIEPTIDEESVDDSTTEETTPEPAEPSNEEPTIETNTQDTKPEAEENKKGILRGLNKLMAKYPKISKLVVAVEMVFLLSEIKDAKDDGVFDHLKNKIVDVISNTDKTEKVLNNENKEIHPDVLEKEMDQLEEKIPEYGVLDIKQLDSIKSPKERENIEISIDKIKIDGFEKFSLSNEKVRQIIQTMPPEFLVNLNKITYVEKIPDMPIEYGISTENKKGKEAAVANRKTREIEVYKTSIDDSPEWIASGLFGHEMFHLQDWFSNKTLTLKERIDLLNSVTERVTSPDRYKSGYVESIKNENKKLELELKAGEYFAEIGAVFLSGEYSKLPEADKNLIRDFLKKVSPNFKRGDALKIRDEIIDYRGTLGPFRYEGESEKDFENRIRIFEEKTWSEELKRMKKDGFDIEGDELESKRKWIEDGIIFYKNLGDKLAEDQKRLMKLRYKN